MTTLVDSYRSRYETVLRPLASNLEKHIQELFRGEKRIDRIAARPKSIDRFVAKAETLVDGKRKYTDPLTQIQDQIGARITTFYRTDVEIIASSVMRYFKPIESRDVVPDSEWEFGYFGRHYILITPSDVIDPAVDRSAAPQFFELQVKTLFQHAWSEANHDLGYKSGRKELTADQKRRLAFTSAQAWGADRIFDELFLERENSLGNSA